MLENILELVLQYATQPPSRVILDAFLVFGWLIFFQMLLFAGLKLLALYKTKRYTSGWKHVLLAVDVPIENLQTPKAVEQLFTHLYSVMDSPSIGYKYRRGYQQFGFSFEIVSIEGYIQFLIRTLEQFRDVVEAAVYAQYPGAEITEVEDYTHDAPHHFPNDTHDMWGCEFAPMDDQAFPIRTYEEFEHSISKDEPFKDPMGTMLESMSRIGRGEQVWFQLLVEPVLDKAWKDGAIKKINEMVGAKEEHASPSFTVAAITAEFRAAFDELKKQIFGILPGHDEHENSADEPVNLVQYLTPGQKDTVAAMEKKITKIGFLSKLRLVYLAKKPAFNPARAVNSFIGAINQFSVPSSNALIPKYLTSAQYFFKDERKNKRKRIITHEYQLREIEHQKHPYVLNIEELATIWHFPMSHVKTPLLQKTLVKKAEPPAGLPTEPIPEEVVAPAEKPIPKKVTDAGFGGFPKGQRFG